jgi:hypothetical protein
MDHAERERIVDHALDRALGTKMVEPRPGLEERILANLPAQREPRAWWRWMWIPALAAVALLAIAIGMKMTQRESPKPVEAKRTVETPKPEVATQQKSHDARKAPEPRVVAHRNPQRRSNPQEIVIAKAEQQPSLPRMDVFPSRGTLTPEEKLLVAFVRQQPSHARSVALEQEARAEEVQKFLEKGQVPAAGPSGITK